ncbi:MAG: hypothetical protein K1X95_07315 [Acidimicrobiia bacterium]|nr:hypothetical protein [Acidimicrobiia bacterium]
MRPEHHLGTLRNVTVTVVDGPGGMIQFTSDPAPVPELASDPIVAGFH